uniref:DRY_EERY domain-containing protein n=1 Tax=Rhodnius prolixus TaxID=13249 RepID=T1I1J4_RHOPR
MWHEVRKQEKKIRCMIVDYRKRAERRKDYYEKIKADPTQFLQVHGRQCKVHLDPAIAAAGDSPANMMSWRGSQDVIIDRFDVRAHLDFIQEYKSEEETKLTYEDRNINYERYRILVQNDFLGVGEEKFLQQLHMEEQFGAVNVDSTMGAAIGLNYDDPTAPVPQLPAAEATDENAETADGQAEDDDSDIDFDVNKVSTQQAHELNKSAHPYGMDGNDFFSFLTKDREEADNLRLAKELEEEKAMYSGRKSRRERRAYRERKLAGRIISPPSYASRKSPTYRDYGDSDSRSRSASPLNSGKITYITSFSVEEPVAPTSPKPPRNDHSRTTKHRSRTPESKRNRYRSRSRSGSNSRKYSRTRKSRSRSKSSTRTSRSKHSSTRRYRSRSVSRSRRSQYKHTSRSASRQLSWSRSSSRSSSRNHQRPESKSRSPQSLLNNPHAEALIKQPPAPIISRYYGRRGRSSSSELSLSDDEKPSTDASTKLNDKLVLLKNNSGVKIHTSGISKITPQERLKKKMQALLNKQYKADKKAEREKREKVEQERIDREDEMREMSIKLRKRERMRRHEYLAEYERLRSDSSHSRSRSP